MPLDPVLPFHHVGDITEGWRLINPKQSRRLEMNSARGSIHVEAPHTSLAERVKLRSPPIIRLSSRKILNQKLLPEGLTVLVRRITVKKFDRVFGILYLAFQKNTCSCTKGTKLSKCWVPTSKESPRATD
jgi:hypothetical protein